MGLVEAGGVFMQTIAHPLGEMWVTANGKNVDTSMTSHVWDHVAYYGKETEVESIVRLLESLSDDPEIAKVEIYLFQVLEHQAAEIARNAAADYWKSSGGLAYEDFLSRAQPPVAQPLELICPESSFRKMYNGFGFDVSGTGHVRFGGPIHGITGAPFDVNVYAFVSEGKLLPLYQGINRRSGKEASAEQLENVWAELQARFLKVAEAEPYLMSKMAAARMAVLAFADRMRPAIAPRIFDVIKTAREQIDVPDELLYGRLKAVGLEAVPRKYVVPRNAEPVQNINGDRLPLLALAVNDAISENAFSWNAPPDMWNWRRRLSSQVAHRQILEIAAAINDVYSKFQAGADNASVDPSFVKAMLFEFDFTNPGSTAPNFRNGIAAAYDFAREHFVKTRKQGPRGN